MAYKKLHLGGFYKHYKHDPGGELGNKIYQVLNIAHTKDPHQQLVIYRPLYASFVFNESKQWDAKSIKEWFMSTSDGKDRYVLVSEPDEISALCELAVTLYGEDEYHRYPMREIVVDEAT